MYYVDKRGYLLKKVGHDFFKLRFRFNSDEIRWELDNPELEDILEYSIEALKSKNRFYDRDYIVFVLKYMKDQFYEDLLG